jgi:IPT/TIG domain
MTTKKLSVVFVTILATFLLAGCPMRIKKVSPVRGLPGTIVTINGNGFDPEPTKNTVTIAGTPTRMINGDTNKLRVIALRNVASGHVVVHKGAIAATSKQVFKRDGSTTRATPLEDSDSKLIEGQGFAFDRRYDMQGQGLNQKILIVLAKPSDVDPEALAPAGKTARQAIVDKLNDPNGSVNAYFQQASYNKVGAAFTVTPDWIALSQIRDFYCWTEDDITRAQTAVDAAQANLDALNLDPSATQAQIDAAKAQLDDAKAKLRNAQNANAQLQEPDFLFAEALIGAKAAVADFDTYSDYFIVVAGPFLRGACCWNQDAYHAESTRLGLLST